MNLKKFVLEGNPVCRKEAVIVGEMCIRDRETTAEP